nr:MAG TPA: hypothetical protein [Caudoviricetes sp.]
MHPLSDIKKGHYLSAHEKTAQSLRRSFQYINCLCKGGI